MTTAEPAAGTNARAAETAARRRRLLDAAAELASEGGYDAVQMRDVAARAEVALGTLYRHYASKDQLLLAVLADEATQLRAVLARRPPRGDTPADRVAGLLRRASRALQRDRALSAAMVTALSSPEPEAAAAKLEAYALLRTMIAGAIDGDDVGDLDAVLRTLGYVWLATLSAWVGGTLDPAEMADDLDAAAHLILDPPSERWVT